MDLDGDLGKPGSKPGDETQPKYQLRDLNLAETSIWRYLEDYSQHLLPYIEFNMEVPNHCC